MTLRTSAHAAVRKFCERTMFAYTYTYSDASASVCMSLYRRAREVCGCVAHAETNKIENNNRGVRHRFVTFLRSRREREQTLLTEILPRIVCIYSAYFYDIYFPPQRDTTLRQSQPAVCPSFLEPRENRKGGYENGGKREKGNRVVDIKCRKRIK